MEVWGGLERVMGLSLSLEIGANGLALLVALEYKKSLQKDFNTDEDLIRLSSEEWRAAAGIFDRKAYERARKKLEELNIIRIQREGRILKVILWPDLEQTNPERSHEGSAEYEVEIMADEGSSCGVTSNTPHGASLGTTGGTPSEATHGASLELSSGTTQRTSCGTPHGTSHGTTHGAPPAPSRGTSYGAPPGTSRGTSHGSMAGSPLGSPPGTHPGGPCAPNLEPSGIPLTVIKPDTNSDNTSSDNSSSENTNSDNSNSNNSNSGNTLLCKSTEYPRDLKLTRYSLNRKSLSRYSLLKDQSYMSLIINNEKRDKEQRDNELLNMHEPNYQTSTHQLKNTQEYSGLENNSHIKQHCEFTNSVNPTKYIKPTKSAIGKTFRELWEKEMGQPLTPYQESGLMLFVRLGYTEEIFMEALRYAVMADRRHMGYILGILRNWHNQNVRTKEDIARAQQDWEDKRFLSRKLS